MRILVVRFSSIGDIVLTTPVVRCLKKQVPNAEIHFITKKTFQSVLEANPYIDQLIAIEGKVSEAKETLEATNYDVVIDLHHNLRSHRVKKIVKAQAHSFDKLNLKKW